MSIMLTHTILFLVIFIFTFNKCYGQDTLENESHNISELQIRASNRVSKKVKKTLSETVTNISSNEKGDIMRSIESKLRKAAEPLGKKGDKYVKLIMQGLRTDTTSNSLLSRYPENKSIEKSPSLSGQNKIHSENSRDTMISLIMDKIKKMSLELNNATSNGGLKSTKLQQSSGSLKDKPIQYYNISLKSLPKKMKKFRPKEIKTLSNNVNSHADAQKKDDLKNSRNSLIDDVLEKINKISESKVEDNSVHVSSIENKLREAAQPLGEKGFKYVNLIMRALRSNNKKIKPSTFDTTSEEVNEVVKESFKLNNVIKDDKDNNEVRKQTIESVAKAISHIINQKNSTNRFNDVIEKIQNTTFEYMKNNDILKDNNKIKSFSDFIADSINLASNKFVLSSLTSKVPRNRIKHISHQVGSSNNDPLCRNTIQRTCTDIHNMNIFKCAYVDESISFYYLCDGKYDCADRSDEKHCAKQAIKKVRYVQNALNALDRSLENDCLVNDINEKVLSKQNLILRDVLKAQLNFIEKYKDENIKVKNIGTPDETIAPPVREITEVIGTLSMALEKALCTDREIKNDRNLRRFNEIFEQDVEENKETSKAIWPPKACSCSEEHCFNCTSACKRICWHKTSLTHWNCDSVNDTSMVSLSVLCDGKYDCYDESDEKDCFTDNVHGKFESHKIFNDITESLKLKATKDYKEVRNKLWSLINVISSLEKLSLQSNPSPASIKDIRDQCFGLLGEIYNNILNHLSFLYEAEDVYMFLLSVNQQLGAILKRIGTGNKKIIADNCFCIKGKCAATYCTRRCQKACIVKPKLTKYYCKNNNKSVGLENICDGKADCPQEDDEKNCSKDVCRTHHITVLRLKVQEIGLKQMGTSMGEVLSTWKTKVLANLKVAEKAGRPTRKVLIELVKDALNDLVITYGDVEDYRRRDNNYALEDFTKIAKGVIDTLRSCEK